MATCAAGGGFIHCRSNIMASYIALMKFTDQGVRTIKETTKRARAVRDTASRFGVNVTSIHWTLGKYDLVTFSEAKDDASATAFALAIASAGNVRMQTLRAFSSDEMDAVLAKLP
jgi:uncharacterized protein with GYD domain